MVHFEKITGDNYVSVKPHRVFTKPQKRGKIVPGGLEKSQDFPGFFKKAEGQE